MRHLPVAIVATAAALLTALPGGSQQPGQTPAAASATFAKYCVTCHNAKLKTGGFVLDPSGLAHIPDQAEQWEKVVRKLRTNAMPPAGVPRPDEATYNSTASFLETKLDRAAAAKPDPGKLPALHRLTR